MTLILDPRKLLPDEAEFRSYAEKKGGATEKAIMTLLLRLRGEEVPEAAQAKVLDTDADFRTVTESAFAKAVLAVDPKARVRHSKEAPIRVLVYASKAALLPEIKKATREMVSNAELFQFLVG